MQYRRLGRCGLKVSAVGLGGWLTHGRTLGEEDTKKAVYHAFDLGVNFFDTADIYSKGEAEKALGKAIKGLRREDLVIATKTFFPMSEAPNDAGLSRKHIFESVDASLKRLGVEYIDLYQFHRFDPETPVDETVRAIDDLIRRGKVLYWGVSEWTAAQIVDVCHVARSLNAHPPASNQPLYNLLRPGIEAEIMPACEREGMGLVVFSPLAQGVLTGKYLPGESPPKGSRGADEKSNLFMTDVLEDKVLAAVHELGELAQEAACTLAQLSLAWCLRRQEVSSVIAGATSVEHLDENVAACELEINPALFVKAEELLGQRL
ncbi:MAG: aldo/keto reductase family protein [Armatimonadetes bacterium]|nr:aldo/keto reductase family protein [Armatimonadota bacterium]